MMDIKGNSPGGVVSISTMLARVAVDKNHEIEQNAKAEIKKPVRHEPIKVASKVAASPEKPKAATTVSSSAHPATGRLVNVRV